jgi:hypothetical protein
MSPVQYRAHLQATLQNNRSPAVVTSSYRILYQALNKEWEKWSESSYPKERKAK